MILLEISCLLNFPDGNLSSCWIFKSIKFYMLMRLGGMRYISMPFFAKLVYPKHLLCLKSTNFLANGVQRIKSHEHVKFWQKQSIGYKDIKIFNFSKGRTPPSWIVKFVKFHWQTVAGMPRLIIMLNVVKSVVLLWILQFFEFSKWPPPPS